MEAYFPRHRLVSFLLAWCPAPKTVLGRWTGFTNFRKYKSGRKGLVPIHGADELLSLADSAGLFDLVQSGLNVYCHTTGVDWAVMTHCKQADLVNRPGQKQMSGR